MLHSMADDDINSRDHFRKEGYNSDPSIGEYGRYYQKKLLRGEHGKHLSADNDRSVLDVGAADGEALAKSFGTKGFKLHATTDDPNPTANGVEFFESGDLEDNIAANPDELDGHYNIVICHRTLRYISNNAQLIGQMMDKVKPGGYLCIDFFSADDGYADVYDDPDGKEPPLYSLPRSAVDQLAASKGFQIIDAETYSLGKDDDLDGATPTVIILQKTP